MMKENFKDGIRTNKVSLKLTVSLREISQRAPELNKIF